MLKPVPGSPEEPDNRWAFSRKKVEDNNEVIQADPVLNYSEEQSRVTRMQGVAVSDHFKANIDKLIMGTRPMSEWDKFIDEIKANGLDELTKAYNDAYISFMQK